MGAAHGFARAQGAASTPRPTEAAGAARLVFANQLRGVAALAVLIIHFTIVVQLMRPDVAWVIAAPPLTTPTLHFAEWLRRLPVDPAATGVGLFFLLSGFVIPFSLQSTTPARFLLARAARILPTFWLALVLEWIVTHLSGAYWGLSPPFSVTDYLLNGLLLSSTLRTPSVDWVSWTLSIEVKFYLLAALCRAPILGAGARYAMIVSVAAYGINVAARHHLLQLPDRLVGEATYLAFISIGVMFHSHLTRRLSTAWLVVASAGVMMLVMLCWLHGPLAGEFDGRSRSLTAAFGLFAVCYAGRAAFRDSRALDFMAGISYPLYLIHAVIGFTFISFLMEAWRVPYTAAALIAFAACAGLATVLHTMIERPTIRAGRLIARKSGTAFPRAR